MLKKLDRTTKYGAIFALIYMVSYLTRVNFSAVISEMERATGFDRELLSLSLTGSFVTYGVGQVISGFAGDRINPKRLISLGLAVTAAMNLLLPLCSSPYAMLAVWCVNGFAQSFMWPPIVKMLTELLTEEEYKKGTVIVSWGCSAGTILVYLIAPVVIAIADWKWVFTLCSACAVLTLILWQRFTYKPSATVQRKVKEQGSAAVLFTPLMFGVMCAIILQGMLRDGVATWIPSYISETYHMSTVSAILTSVIMPVFSVVCYQIAAGLYRNKIKNPMLCAGVFFGAGAVFGVLLLCVTGKNAICSLLFSALLTGCMHGVNLMLISMIPPFFKRYGMTGTASGVLNSCTYIGSAASTYGVAVLSRMTGWQLTMLIWLGITLLGTALCIACIKPWKKQFNDSVSQ